MVEEREKCIIHLRVVLVKDDFKQILHFTICRPFFNIYPLFNPNQGVCLNILKMVKQTLNQITSSLYPS